MELGERMGLSTLAKEKQLWEDDSKTKKEQEEYLREAIKGAITIGSELFKHNVEYNKANPLVNGGMPVGSVASVLRYPLIQQDAVHMAQMFLGSDADIGEQEIRIGSALAKKLNADFDMDTIAVFSTLAELAGETKKNKSSF